MHEFRVLGPVELSVQGRDVSLPAAKPRALLALLLLSRNRVVPVGQLIDDLWGESPPETAPKALQGYVSQLRKLIGADRLLTKPPGYSMRIAPGELDLDRFEQLIAEGRTALSAGDPGTASRLLGEALALWRGRPFAEFNGEPFARDASARLEEERLSALEDRFDADLALGRHAALVPEVEGLVAREPFRERVRAQLMLALYRSGRQAEALEVYRTTRETLVEELGIEPGAELQELERAILRQDSALGAGRPPPKQGVVRSSPRRRSRWLISAAVAALAALAGSLVFAFTRGGSEASSSAGGRNAGLAAFVVKLENFLDQSHEGRLEVTATIGRASHCALGRPSALRRLNRVQRNRQSLLQQVAALSVPRSDEALRASDLYQQAIQASISADWHYRDWLLARTRCPPPARDLDLRAARAADVQATRRKQAFLTAFNPLARRLDKREWRASEF